VTICNDKYWNDLLNGTLFWGKRHSCTKGGLFANKIRTSQIRKFADLNFLKDLRTFRKYYNLRICDLLTIYCCNLRICDLRTQLFCGHKTSANPQIHNIYPNRFKLVTVLSYMACRSLKYSYVGKDDIRGKPMRIWSRNTEFFLANLRMCDLRTGIQRKSVDLWINHYNLRTCDCRMSPRICGFLICGVTKKVFVPTFSSHTRDIRDPFFIDRRHQQK
jgi:hypothetical protein